jgi:hypothetical protein
MTQGSGGEREKGGSGPVREIFWSGACFVLVATINLNKSIIIRVNNESTACSSLPREYRTVPTFSPPEKYIGTILVYHFPFFTPDLNTLHTHKHTHRVLTRCNDAMNTTECPIHLYNSNHNNHNNSNSNSNNKSHLCCFCCFCW